MSVAFTVSVVEFSDVAENANDSLKGRVVEISLADLQNDQEQGFRKIKLRVEEISVGVFLSL